MHALTFSRPYPDTHAQIQACPRTSTFTYTSTCASTYIYIYTHTYTLIRPVFVLSTEYTITIRFSILLHNILIFFFRLRAFTREMTAACTIIAGHFLSPFCFFLA